MIENTILSGLLYNEDFARKVAPFIRGDYFEQRAYKEVFRESIDYLTKYNGLPTKEALKISIDEHDDLSEQDYAQIMQVIDGLVYNENIEQEWLIEKTEKFCQDRAIYNAVRESILVLDGKHKSHDKGAIPELLAEALAVSFDNSIGHDYLDNSDERYDFYHTKEQKVAFDLDIMNKITKGGLSLKTLSIVLAGTGVGKTLFMTHCAAANLSAGLNVLYITMEMAEERIAERIDANLLDLTVDELRTSPREVYVRKMDRLKSRTGGKLVIKEYPTASAGSAHFRHLLNELRLKKSFRPDVIYIDYLNICSSSRIKHGANVNSYTLIKAIAEELRGLAVEFNVPIMSATQTTRSGFSSSDVELTDTSESFGLPATADFMFALISSEELEALGQLMVKQLKNRWGDTGYYKKFVIGIDRPKMRLFDAEDDAQTLTDDSPTMDRGSIGERLSNERSEFSGRGKSNFKGFS